jgi:hypothetical protein
MVFRRASRTASGLGTDIYAFSSKVTESDDALWILALNVKHFSRDIGQRHWIREWFAIQKSYT